MQQKLQEQRQMLDRMQAPNMASDEANQRRHEPPRARPRVIPIEEDSEHLESDAEEEGEYRQRRHLLGRHNYGLKSPLSEELEEVQCNTLT